MIFVDQVAIHVKGGEGGNGHVSFRREKFMPKGGPDGGDGGRGGDVILEASHRLGTLYDFRHRERYMAQDGERGMANNCAGADGGDLVIEVPVGTLVKDKETGLLSKTSRRTPAGGGRRAAAAGGELALPPP